MELKMIVYLKTLKGNETEPAENGFVGAGETRIFSQKKVDYLLEFYQKGTIAEISMTDEDWQNYIDYNINYYSNKINFLNKLLDYTGNWYNHSLPIIPDLEGKTLEEKVKCVQEFIYRVNDHEHNIKSKLIRMSEEKKANLINEEKKDNLIKPKGNLFFKRR